MARRLWAEKETKPLVRESTGSKQAIISHLLRGLGAYLDRMELSAFNIAWTPDRVSVECLKHGAQSERKTFSPKELYKLGLRMNFRRAPHSATA